MGRGFEPPPGHACPPREVLESCAVLVFHALEHGMRIDVALVDGVPLGVDTPGDLDRARAMLAG